MSGSLPSSPLLLPLLSLCLLLVSITTSGIGIFTNTTIPSCPSASCGNVHDIRYPFWVVNDASSAAASPYCGYPRFNITCHNETPILSLSNNNYTLTGIDYNSRTISLTDSDVLLSSATCPKLRHNFTLESNPLLAYTRADAILAFFFNCSDVQATDPVPCLGAFGGKQSYIFTIDEIPTPSVWVETCAEVFMAPVLHDVLLPAMSGLNTGFGGVLRQGFQLRWNSSDLEDCHRCENSGGQCAYYEVTGNSNSVFNCHCRDSPIKVGQCRSDMNMYKKILIGVIVVLLGFLFACALLFYLCRRRMYENSTTFPRKKPNNVRSIEAFLEKYGTLAPRRYTYSDVTKMTKSFTVKLGQGGFGIVFKGNLIGGHPVAVKVLIESKGDGEEFVNEVASIGRTSHVNIVSLLGFCLEGTKRALIYDFMPNGSLDKYIYTDKSNSKIPFGWEKLYNIALGVARGLEYLHRGCNTRIVHLDIKPHNILLDGEFCPKISDFGLAKLCLEKNSSISLVGTRGTVGYIAPEVFNRNFGVVSSKSDVYSYGMMVLEMVGGRKNIDAKAENTSQIYYPHWIYEHLEGDSEAWRVTKETEEIARKMILVGLWCIQTLPRDRPSMSKVVHMLEGCTQNLQMPPKPYLSSPVRSTHDSSTISIF